MQRGQVGLEGASGLGLWQSRTYSRVSTVLSAPVLGVGHQLGLLSWEN